LKEISTTLGCSLGVAGQKIHVARVKYGLAWFPLRNPNYDLLPIPRNFQQLWNHDLTIKQIAERHNTSENQVNLWLVRARARDGIAAFPHHRQKRDTYSRGDTEGKSAYSRRLKALLKPANDLWLDMRLSIKKLSKTAAIPETRLRSLIAIARREFGPRWFPMKSSKISQRFLKKRLKKEIVTANKLWHDGLRAKEIAQLLNLGEKEFERKITLARQLIGDHVFPTRQLSPQERKKRTDQASLLWKKGLRLPEIAKIIGIKRSTLNFLIYISRKNGDSAFKRRRERQR
jgi:DNA-binding CsgD family transcriptional regulator